jgi:hypothetical protein
MRHLTLTLALSITALGLFGCGNDESASSATALAPAGSVFYGEVTLEPEGEQKEAVERILSKFPGEGGADARLAELIEKGLRESDAPITFEEDVEPWLGAEAAFFAGGEQLRSAAGLIATDDEGAARDALEQSFDGEPQTETYKDTEYLYDGETAGAVFDGFLVVGSEAGLKAAIDTSDGGSPLADDDAYSNALEDAEDDRLGLFYLNSPALYKTVRSGAAGLPLGDSLEKFFEEPYVATVAADDDGVTFEAEIPESFTKAVPFFSPGSDVVSGLPADSWLALGQPDLGKTLDAYVGAVAGAFGGRDALEQQLQATTGLSLQEVLSWMGDFAIFMRGGSVDELEGALVVETSDPAASGRLIEWLRSLAESQDDPSARVEPLSAPGGGEGFTIRSTDVAQPVHVFQRDERFVIAYGDSAARDAISPSQKLGSSPEFSSASESLDGYDISFYMAIEPILELAEAEGAGSEEDYQEAKPYLEPLGALIGGTKGGEGDLRTAFKLTVP